MGRVRKHLTYSNVMVTVLTFVVLGGGAYAAAHLKKNTVKSKQIKDGQVKTQDIADGAVDADKLAKAAATPQEIAANSLTGTEIDESTLTGIDAAKTGGMEVKKINFQVPFGTQSQSILTYPGIFRIDASCQNSGDRIDLTAFTGRDNSKISKTAFRTYTGDDTDATRDLVTDATLDFDTNTPFELDNYTEFGTPEASETVHFSTPDGFVSTTELSMEYSSDSNGCVVTGVSIGG